MQPFEYHNPTRIIFGEKTVTQTGIQAAAIGKKALLLYGQSSIKNNGTYEKIVSSLKAAGVEFLEHPGVKSNPTLNHARDGVKLARDEQVDVILGVGGGSVIDEAKAIAAGVGYHGDLWDFFCGKAQPKKSLPILAVLTLAATGSEMNDISVLTNENTQTKFRFVSPHSHPTVSILDPQLTHTVSLEYTAYSGVDAMSHLMEPYFTHSQPWAPIQERYAEGLIKTIRESTDKIIADPRHKDGRAEMMWAATLAWNGLHKAGLGPIGMPNHMLGMALGALFDLPHGATLSIALPAWMTYFAKKDPTRFAQFARNVFDITDPDPHTAAMNGINAYRQWCDAIGSPTSLKAAGIGHDQVEKIIALITRDIPKWNAQEYTPKVLRDIFQLCL